MEKLDKVIAGIEKCWFGDDVCGGCLYAGSADDGCGRNLERDTLEVLKELSADNQRLRDMWADAVLELSRVQQERDFLVSSGGRAGTEYEPVVHAHWEWKDLHGDGLLTLCCSNCLGTDGARETAKFCPECGAHMDEEAAK